MTTPVTDSRCPAGGGQRCRCRKCAICGYRVHTNIHGEFYPDNKPPAHGHEFQARETV